MQKIKILYFKIANFVRSTMLFLIPFVVCPCEKHLIANSAIGLGILGTYKIFKKKQVKKGKCCNEQHTETNEET